MMSLVAIKENRAYMSLPGGAVQRIVLEAPISLTPLKRMTPMIVTLVSAKNPSTLEPELRFGS
jgi:hypothetical protein